MKINKSSLVMVTVTWLALLIAGPLIVIWAVNTLFNANIEFTLINWIAMMVLLASGKASKD